MSVPASAPPSALQNTLTVQLHEGSPWQEVTLESCGPHTPGFTGTAAVEGTQPKPPLDDPVPPELPLAPELPLDDPMPPELPLPELDPPPDELPDPPGPFV